MTVIAITLQEDHVNVRLNGDDRDKDRSAGALAGGIIGLQRHISSVQFRHVRKREL